ncbi:unnamed protein product, partial [Symbiodinium sp. KB8]
MCCVVVEEGNAELEVVVLSQQLVSVEVEVGLREVEVEWALMKLVQLNLQQAETDVQSFRFFCCEFEQSFEFFCCESEQGFGFFLCEFVFYSCFCCGRKKYGHPTKFSFPLHSLLLLRLEVKMVDLLSYGLRAEALVRPKTLQADDESTDVEQEETSLGVWKDSLANLDDRIAYRSHQLHFNASLHNKEASTTAKLELLTDIYVDGTEPHDEPVTLSKKPHLDVFTGLMRKGGKQNEQLFYVSVAALGLKHLSNPILKVFSAAGVKEATKPSYDEEEDLTTWQECLAVATSRSSSKVRFEIWSEGTLSQAGQLVGQ